jgi:hypothetical protein
VDVPIGDMLGQATDTDPAQAQSSPQSLSLCMVDVNVFYATGNKKAMSKTKMTWGCLPDGLGSRARLWEVVKTLTSQIG